MDYLVVSFQVITGGNEYVVNINEQFCGVLVCKALGHSAHGSAEHTWGVA
jgi:hypothetical protein